MSGRDIVQHASTPAVLEKGEARIVKSPSLSSISNASTGSAPKGLRLQFEETSSGDGNGGGAQSIITVLLVFYCF